MTTQSFLTRSGIGVLGSAGATLFTNGDNTTITCNDSNYNYSLL